jgi:hypothetical protein
MKEDSHSHMIRRTTWNRSRPVAIAIFTVLLISEAGWGWGRLGHRAAARMAEARLNPHALAAIHDLIGPGVSLADISTWADEQKYPKSSPSAIHVFGFARSPTIALPSMLVGGRSLHPGRKRIISFLNLTMAMSLQVSLASRSLS